MSLEFENEFSTLCKDLLCKELGRMLLDCYPPKDFSCHDFLSIKTLLILQDIQEVLQLYDNNDFDTVERIVEIFEKNHLSVGNCHDFG